MPHSKEDYKKIGHAHNLVRQAVELLQPFSRNMNEEGEAENPADADHAADYSVAYEGDHKIQKQAGKMKIARELKGMLGK